jgi:hypothetical protein
MVFFNVDDHAHSHPKFRRPGLAAVGLWAMSGSWARAHKQDGFVPDWFVCSWPNGKRLAAALVDAKLWYEGEHEGQAGWFYHDWLDIHDGADEVEQQRAKNRERQRQRRARLRAGGDPA